MSCPSHQVRNTAAVRLASVDAYLAAVGATVRLGGDRAFYSPATDSITLPRPEQFESGAAFYGTALHEHAHWVGAPSRLAREFGVHPTLVPSGAI
jgi:putative DNA primase/helicase